ncbi:MAG: hypothetical protein ACI9SE_004378 [Neolewinella sp.]|jgi:hypothetical protein
MPSNRASLLAVTVTALTLATGLRAQTNFTVVPPQHAVVDANHQTGVPGVVDQRTQILVGASQLTAMAGRSIEAIELRRSAADESFTGGAVNLTVNISVAPHPPLDCSATFSQNIGANPTTVFSGLVSVPTSPAITGSNVAWTPDNVVRIPIVPPYPYTGGPLCIDITGHPVAGQEVQWWAADATYQQLPGTTTDLGGGCSSNPASLGNWSSIETHSLVTGGHARMLAFGSPYGLAIAAIGPQSAPIPLTTLGINPPGACALRVFPVTILIPTLFIPDPDPAFAASGGLADLLIKMPNTPAAQGFTLTTQWFDWSQQATSNAIEWTIASSVPSLDMASIEGHALDSIGNASVHIAPVIRFEHQ